MSDSLFQSNENRKSEKFRKNEKLNALLAELKEMLAPLQREKEQQAIENNWPVAFIVGAPRSGTTLLLQWLASTGCFAYPSNLLTRFAYAPYLGALIQKMLFDPDYDFHGELADIQSSLNFESNLGKSSGALATSEFQHFFRNYMPNFDPEYLEEDSVGKVDFEGMKRGLALLEQAFEKPFVTKALMLQYNIPHLAAKLDNTVFLYIRRKPVYNMQSVLLAREKYYSDRKIWWSVKPKAFEWLKTMDVYHQIAGQVYYTNQAIENALSDLPDHKKLMVDYESLCAHPETYYTKMVEIYRQAGYSLSPEYKGPSQFDNTNSPGVPASDLQKLKDAYRYFSDIKSAR